MPKIIYKQQHVGSNGRKFSASRNAHYVKYIGEREHVLKSSHESNLVKYMGEREHAARQFRQWAFRIYQRQFFGQLQHLRNAELCPKNLNFSPQCIPQHFFVHSGERRGSRTADAHRLGGMGEIPYQRYLQKHENEAGKYRVPCGGSPERRDSRTFISCGGTRRRRSL